MKKKLCISKKNIEELRLTENLNCENSDKNSLQKMYAKVQFSLNVLFLTQPLFQSNNIVGFRNLLGIVQHSHGLTFFVRKTLYKNSFLENVE